MVLTVVEENWFNTCFENGSSWEGYIQLAIKSTCSTISIEAFSRFTNTPPCSFIDGLDRREIPGPPMVQALSSCWRDQLVASHSTYGDISRFCGAFVTVMDSTIELCRVPQIVEMVWMSLAWAKAPQYNPPMHGPTERRSNSFRRGSISSPREILLSSKLHHECDFSQITHQNMLLHVNHMVTLHCCHLCRTVPES